MKGRKKIPTKIKESRGTLQKCRANPNEPDYVTMNEIPDPPEYLTEYGKGIYYDTADELLQNGILTKISFPIFIIYCIEISRYFDAINQINEKKAVFMWEGPTGRKLSINPYHRISMDALHNVMRIACEFGITPASQSKITAGVKDKKDELDKLMDI